MPWLAMFLLPPPVLAAPKERPTVGLVLSGGGARGCAHAGVLEVLEELRVPVDAIAGTSMGAVVGGFYAAGLSPREIEDGLAAVDWSGLFTDGLGYRELSLRRKAEARRFVDLELGWRDGRAAFPTALLGGRKLDLIFRSATLSALGIEDFDDLPIPFRAVATDLATGLPLVLGDGDLPSAMRASMSIPGVFAPTEIDGHILADGGLTANLPVATVRELGADVTLVVDVSSPLLDEAALDSVFGVLAQTFSLLGIQETVEQAATADLLVRPQIEASPIQFERCPDLFAAGAAAARARSAELSAYGLSEPEWREHLRLRAERRVPPPVTVASVRIEGAESSDPRRIARRVRIQPGDPFDLETIAEDLERIYGLGELELAQVFFEPGPEGVAVIYRLREKSWGPGIVRFGLFAADDLEGNARTDLLVGFTRSSINRRGGELRVELQAGRTRRAFGEFYQPLDFGGRWFVAPMVEESRTLTDVYDQDRKVAEYSVDRTIGGGDLGWVVGPALELRLGARRGRTVADVAVGAAPLPDLEVDVAALVGSATLDRLDSAGIPRQGYFVRLAGYSSLTDLGADDRYDKLTADLSLFASRGRHGLFGQLAAGASPGSELPAYDEFTLGGLQSLSGFGDGQLRGQSFAVGRLGYGYRVYELPPTLGGTVYLFGWAEAGNVGEGPRPGEISDLVLTGTLALGIETRLGPLYVAYGAAEGGFERFYAALGKRF